MSVGASGFLPSNSMVARRQLQPVFAIKCPFNEDACGHAAENGHWHCLEYLVDNELPGWEEYDEETTRAHIAQMVESPYWQWALYLGYGE